MHLFTNSAYEVQNAPNTKTGFSNRFFLTTLFMIALGFMSVSTFAQDCLTDYSLTSTPADDAGTYEAGECGDFYFRVSSAGIPPLSIGSMVMGVEVGSGWDASSIATTPAASCDGDGVWQWFDASTDVGSDVSLSWLSTTILILMTIQQTTTVMIKMVDWRLVI